MCDLENIIFLLITKYPETEAVLPKRNWEVVFCGWQLFPLDFSNTI